jgi:hypothetical protein
MFQAQTTYLPSDKVLIATVLLLLRGFDVKMGSTSSEYDFIVIGGGSILLEIRTGF